MPVISQEKGSYAQPGVVRIYGSFQTNAAAAPTVIRDGNSRIIASVVRTSAGLYTVTLDTGFPIPERLIAAGAHLHSSATPTIIAQANYVTASYSQSARTFQVVVYHTSGTPGVGDPDTGDRVSFELVGAIISSGTDPA